MKLFSRGISTIRQWWRLWLLLLRLRRFYKKGDIPGFLEELRVGWTILGRKYLEQTCAIFLSGHVIKEIKIFISKVPDRRTGQQLAKVLVAAFQSCFADLLVIHFMTAGREVSFEDLSSYLEQSREEAVAKLAKESEGVSAVIFQLQPLSSLFSPAA